jgi:hypothetical protein
VRVTNAAGNVVSGNALLTVTLRLLRRLRHTGEHQRCTQPTGGAVGHDHGGTMPVSYQWKRDGNLIAGATNASYTITAVDYRDNAAAFVLDITIPRGTFSTQAATLTVLPTGTPTVITVDTTDDLCRRGRRRRQVSHHREQLFAARRGHGVATCGENFDTVINIPAGIYSLTRVSQRHLRRRQWQSEFLDVRYAV